MSRLHGAVRIDGVESIPGRRERSRSPQLLLVQALHELDTSIHPAKRFKAISQLALGHSEDSPRATGAADHVVEGQRYLHCRCARPTTPSDSSGTVPG